MEVIYGCECTDCPNHGNHNNAPVAFIVERNGKELKVCTKCDLSSDKKIARLFDKETETKPFFDYDTLGAFCMAGYVNDEYWNEVITRKI